jgi:hypothetical protein
MKGKLKDLTRNMDGSWNLTVTVNGDCRAIWEKYKEKDVDVDVKQYREKRSLTANAFCWALCSDIAKALRPPIPKEEVYRKAIRDVGEYEPFPVKEAAVERFQSRWAGKGVGWFADVIDDSKIPGYKLVFAYYGSSVYDTEEMSTLIDYLVDDAEQMGIPIPLGKEEMERLKADWRAI